VFHRSPWLDTRTDIWDLKDDFTDTSIICSNGRTKIRAHKIILAASSNYLKSKLRINNEILLAEYSRGEILLLMEYIYSGQVSLKKENITPFFALGRRVEIKGLPDEKEFVKNIKEQFKDGFTVEEQLKENCIFSQEVLINIFSYIPTQDLLINVAKTSKLFHCLTKDPEVHLRVELRYNVDQAAACQFLTSTTRIQELVISGEMGYKLALRSNMSTVSGNLLSVNFCDDILTAVANHNNLRVVTINTGLKASTQCFNLLASTNFFKKLSNLYLSIDAKPNDNFDMVAAAISSAGKLRQLELKGFDKVDSSALRNIAVSCKNLEELSVDCLLLSSDVTAILTAHKNSIQQFLSKNENPGQDVLDSQKQCKKLMYLIRGSSYPLSIYKNGFENIKRISYDGKRLSSENFLDCNLNPGSLPCVETLVISSEKKEIFLTLGKACPNLKKIIVSFIIEESNLEDFKELFSAKKKLKSVWLFAPKACQLNISDLWKNKDNASQFPELKLIGFNFGSFPQREATSLFKLIPSLEGVSYEKRLFVRGERKFGFALNCVNSVQDKYFEEIHALRY